MTAREPTGIDPLLRGMAYPTPLRDALLLTGAEAGRWHAVDPAGAAASTPVHSFSGQPTAGLALCRLWVRIARSFGVFDRDLWGCSACPQCSWTLALRAGVGAVAIEAARWTDPVTEPLGRLLVRVAVAIVRARTAHMAPTGLDDDPVAVQLLTAVGAHAPIALYGCSCVEGDCDHHPDGDPDEFGDSRPGAACPVSAVVCPACSLPVETGLDGGEGGGGFLDECTIPAPCQVLATIAARFGVPLPTATQGVTR